MNDSLERLISKKTKCLHVKLDFPFSWCHSYFHNPVNSWLNIKFCPTFFSLKLVIQRKMCCDHWLNFKTLSSSLHPRLSKPVWVSSVEHKRFLRGFEWKVIFLEHKSLRSLYGIHHFFKTAPFVFNRMNVNKMKWSKWWRKTKRFSSTKGKFC